MRRRRLITASGQPSSLGRSHQCCDMFEMRMRDTPLPSRLPRLVFSTSVGVTVLAVLSYVASGNTLMHHYRTGTVQRDSSPTWFWWIVVVQGLTAVALAVIAHVGWRSLHGAAA